jgi:SagB-type dehydrogenase family enzyme
MAENMDEPGRLLRSRWNELEDFVSDQRKGLPAPGAQPDPPDGAHIVELPPADRSEAGPALGELLANRRSIRSFAEGDLTLAELSFLLWAVQGTLKSLPNGASFRTAPSGGARHPLNTYVFIRRATGLEPGLYAYLPLDHKLWLKAPHPGTDGLVKACHGQSFVGGAQLGIFWAAVMYRTSWRYGPASAKLVALDAGHACQNLYLACGHLGLGTCAIGAYDQDEADRLLGLDGDSETTVYIAPVGRYGG